MPISLTDSPKKNCGATGVICRAVLIGCFLLFAINLISQNLYFKKYQVENGLSNNSIYACLQDSRGYLWFGSLDGLNRFDGFDFKVFRAKQNDSTSLRSNFVTCLQEDKVGNLWVGTTDGLYKYNYVKECFELLQFSKNQTIRDIDFDEEGNLWCIILEHVYKFAIQTKSLIQIGKGELTAPTSFAIIGNFVWIANNYGYLYSYSKQTKKINSYDVFASKHQTVNKRIEKLYCADGNRILIGTVSNGVKTFDISKSIVTDFITTDLDGTNLFVRDILQGSKDEYWIGTESGLIIANINTKQFTYIKKNSFDPYSISDNAVYCLSKDKEGGIWIGTYFGGINYYSRQNSLFKKYNPNTTANSIKGDIVREIVKDSNNNLWVGTEDFGLNKINPATGKITNYNVGSKSINISHSNIHGLIVHGNELWVGTFEHGIDVIDLNKEVVVKHYETSNSLLLTNFIVTFYLNREKDLLVGTFAGLYKYNLLRKDFDRIKEIPRDCFVYGMCEDEKGRLWVGSMGSGIQCISSQNETNTQKLVDSLNKIIYSRKVQKIFKDSENNLWIATGGDGLIKVLSKTNVIERYTTGNGLSSNFVLNVIEDDFKTFWITTTKGLNRYSPDKQSFQQFSKANGLLSDQFSYNSGFIDKNGSIYFGSLKGMISFDPADFTKVSQLGKLQLTDFKFNENDTQIGDAGFPLDSSISLCRRLVLKYNQSSFTLQFSPLRYENFDVTSYKYKLKGLHQEWINLGHSLKISFTNLPVGNYMLQIQASNSVGNLMKEPFSFPIIITPPLWAGKTAFAIYGILAAGIIYLLFRNHNNRLREKNKRKIEQIEHEKETRLYKSKIEFFTYVAHEIKTPLTLILAPMEKVLKHAVTDDIRKYLELMKRNTTQLLDLSQQLLDFRQVETHGFALSFVKQNINELLADTFNSFTTIANDRFIRYELKVPPKEEVHAFIDKEGFSKIITNLIANAIKYSNTIVTVELLAPVNEAKEFTIMIKNDGLIIPFELREKIFEPFFRLKEAEKQSGSGLGLSLCKLLAELHKGKVELAQPLHNENVFVLTIPMMQNGQQ